MSKSLQKVFVKARKEKEPEESIVSRAFKKLNIQRANRKKRYIIDPRELEKPTTI